MFSSIRSIWKLRKIDPWLLTTLFSIPSRRDHLYSVKFRRTAQRISLGLFIQLSRCLALRPFHSCPSWNSWLTCSSAHQPLAHQRSVSFPHQLLQLISSSASLAHQLNSSSAISSLGHQLVLLLLLPSLSGQYSGTIRFSSSRIPSPSHTFAKFTNLLTLQRYLFLCDKVSSRFRLCER